MSGVIKNFTGYRGWFGGMEYCMSDVKKLYWVHGMVCCNGVIYEWRH